MPKLRLKSKQKLTDPCTHPDFVCLNGRQQIFVMEYAQDFNASRAAREAGYAGPHVKGNSLLADPRIQKALRAIVKPVMEEAKLNQEDIYRQLYNICFCNIAKYYNEDNELAIPICDLPEEVQQCIEGIDVTPHFDREGNLLRESTKLKLVSKASVLRMILEALKCIDNVHEHHHTFDWDGLYAMMNHEPPTVEAEIQKLTVIPAETNGKAK